MHMARKILGVLGGQIYDEEILRNLAQKSDFLIAADSGADACLKAGLVPFVIGDMDSFVCPPDMECLEIADQNSSDVDKMLEYLSQQEPGCDLVITGIEGDRLDHVLATLSSFVAKQVSVRLVLKRMSGWVMISGKSQVLEGLEDNIISVIPYPECDVTITGAEWPLENAHLKLGENLSLSNVAQEKMSITVHAGSAICLVDSQIEPW